MNTEELEKYLGDDEELDTFIEDSITRLNELTTMEEFMDFCVTFHETVENPEVLQVIHCPDSAWEKNVRKLKAAGYPKDFIEWHLKFGENYLWIGSTKIITTASVVQEFESDWFSLMTNNGFLILTTDASGNGFVLDTHLKTAEIKFADHNNEIEGSDTFEEISQKLKSTGHQRFIDFLKWKLKQGISDYYSLDLK